MPEVSVIVPTRNRASYLDECLKALAGQDCAVDYEVVVVDNGSTDHTNAVIATWCSRDTRVRAVVEERVGLSAAKNAGVRNATGELVLFADDDVIVGPRWVAAYRALFARRGLDGLIAGGPLIPIPHDLGEWPSWFTPRAIADLGELDYRRERALGDTEYVWGGNMAVPAALFERFGGWDETVGRRGDERGTFEDVEYQERMRGAGVEVWFSPSTPARHRIERSTITQAGVLGTAFARGRNDYWSAKLHAAPEPLPGPTAVGFARLTLSLGSWVIWSAALRLTNSASAFDRAHDSAFRSGRLLDLVRDGRESSLFGRALGRLALAALTLATAIASPRSS
jgi:GT2 family glycosyltransferase